MTTQKEAQLSHGGASRHLYIALKLPQLRKLLLTTAELS